MTSLRHKLSRTLGKLRVEPRKELLRQLHFLIHKMGRQHYLFAKGLLVFLTSKSYPVLSEVNLAVTTRLKHAGPEYPVHFGGLE